MFAVASEQWSSDWDAEFKEANKRAQSGLPPKPSRCPGGECSVTKRSNQVDPYAGYNELQTVATFLGYSDGYLLDDTQNESKFSAIRKNGEPGGDPEQVEKLLREIIKHPIDSAERKAAVDALRSYRYMSANGIVAEEITPEETPTNSKADTVQTTLPAPPVAKPFLAQYRGLLIAGTVIAATAAIAVSYAKSKAQ